MKQNPTSQIAPTVRDYLVCPRCGQKTLSYESTDTELIYECLSPSCSYWSRKPRMQDGSGSGAGVILIAAIVVAFLLMYGLGA